MSYSRYSSEEDSQTIANEAEIFEKDPPINYMAWHFSFFTKSDQSNLSMAANNEYAYYTKIVSVCICSYLHTVCARLRNFYFRLFPGKVVVTVYIKNVLDTPMNVTTTLHKKEKHFLEVHELKCKKSPFSTD